MTASDKKKTSILVLLLLIAGLSWYYMYRPAGTPTSSESKAAVTAKSVANTGQEAQIRTDIVENTSGVNVGQNNLFAYRQPPVAAKPPEAVRPVTQPAFTPPQPTAPIQVQPAVQPWKSFRYEGFSLMKGGKPLGSISEGGTTYEVKEGDCMMGQYCITRLTDSLVEIEDLQLKRKQTFTRVQ